MVFALRDSFIMTCEILQVTGRAKTTPWLLSSGTTIKLKYQPGARHDAQPTLTTSTTGPLCAIVPEGLRSCERMRQTYILC